MQPLITELKKYIKKGEKPLHEAKKDLQIGCYNRATCASYFAVEAYANILFLINDRK